MSMKETAAILGESSALIGIVSEPADRLASSPSSDRPAVVILNAGVIHRVGPSLFTVRLARWLARQGLLAVRFDHSGVGDSRVRQDRLPWSRSTVLETREVMNDLRDAYGAKRFVLVGLCSGAVTAFKTACADPRVVGVVLLNSQSPETDDGWNRYVRARRSVRRYWRQSRSGIAFWRGLIAVLGRQIRHGVFPPRQVSSVTDRLSSQLCDLIDRGVRCLFLHTVGDPSVEYFDVITAKHRRRLEQSGLFREVAVSRADHTFTLLGSQREVLRIIEEWTTAEWMEAADESAQRLTPDSPVVTSSPA